MILVDMCWQPVARLVIVIKLATELWYNDLGSSRAVYLFKLSWVTRNDELGTGILSLVVLFLSVRIGVRYK